MKTINIRDDITATCLPPNHTAVNQTENGAVNAYRRVSTHGYPSWTENEKVAAGIRGELVMNSTGFLKSTMSNIQVKYRKY